MNEQIILKEKINGSTTMSIEAVNEAFTVESKFYAINWFDLKRPVFYKFYNILVGPLLYKVGGRLHFKGTFDTKLQGTNEDGRQMLLIVYYPNIPRFVKLVKKKFFQLASILRILSVKDFNFGFTNRTDGSGPPTSKKEANLRYLVHHFTTENEGIKAVDTLKEILKQMEISLFYVGEIGANIIVERKGKKAQKAPFLMDGIMVFESSNNDRFSQLLEDPIFTKFNNQFKTSYLATFNRIG